MKKEIKDKIGKVRDFKRATTGNYNTSLHDADPVSSSRKISPQFL